MQRIRSFGLLAGAWFVPRSQSAIGEAQKCAGMVTRLNPDCVMLDVETHDLSFQRVFIAEYRRLKPGRATDVTFEPRQDESTVAVFDYLSARFDLFPQLYEAKMRPADAKHELVAWLRFVAPDKIHFCLNAAQDWWGLDDGLLFQASTLPDKRPVLRQLLGAHPRTVKRAHDKLAASLPTLEPVGDETEA